MLIIDKLLISGIRWALDKVVNAVDAEMNNEDVLREELLAAQMRYELGEMSEDEFAEIEAGVLRALREIQDRKRGATGPREALGGEGTKISSVDISFGGDEGEESLGGGEEGVRLGAGAEEAEIAGPHASEAATPEVSEHDAVPGIVEVETYSEVREEPEEAQLAIEAAGVEAPVIQAPSPAKTTRRKARARKPREAKHAPGPERKTGSKAKGRQRRPA